MAHLNLLKKDKTALVIVDFQEAFREMIPDFYQLAANIIKITKGFGILGLPVVVTEQYPKGLGHTAKEVTEVCPENFVCIEKTAFSSCGASEFLETLSAQGADQILLCGLETHICVNQTAHDLLDNGFQVHVLEDAVGSRTDANKQIGLDKMKGSGAIPSCIEMSLFELMRDAKHAHFKEIQNLIK